MSRAGFYLFSSTIFFAFVNTGVKFLEKLPASEIVFFRGLITLFLCLYFIRKNSLYLWGNNKKLLLLRGVFGTIALYSMFYSIKVMPLAIATMFAALNSLFAALAFHVFLKEKTNFYQYFFLLLALAGVLVIKGCGMDSTHLTWSQLFWGLLTPVASSLAYTCVRKLGATDNPLVVIFYFPFISTPVMFPALLSEGVMPSGFELVIIVIVGIFTQVAQYLMTLAFQKETASKIAIYNYAGIIWGVLIGFFIFGERLSLQQYFGILIIIFSILGFEYFKRKYQDLPKQV